MNKLVVPVLLVLGLALGCDGNAGNAGAADTEGSKSDAVPGDMATDSQPGDGTADSQPEDGGGDTAAGCTHPALAAALAGPGALDCGHVELPSPATAAYACFVQAVQQGKPARASFATAGTDSFLVRALIRRPSGVLGVLHWDSSIMGAGDKGPADATFERCIGPSIAAPGGVPALHCDAWAPADALCPPATLPDAATSAALGPWGPGALLVEGRTHPAEKAFPPMPTAWTSLTVQKGFGPCPPGMNCSQTFVVSPTGSVQATIEGQPTSKLLSIAQVQTLHELVGPAGFLQAMQDGFVCPQPPTDVGVSLVFATTGGTWTQQVTGCVFGDATSAPARLHALVSSL